MRKPTLTDISGIGPVAAAELAAAGIREVRQLAEAPLEQIESVRGFGGPSLLVCCPAAGQYRPCYTGIIDRQHRMPTRLSRGN